MKFEFYGLKRFAKHVSCRTAIVGSLFLLVTATNRSDAQMSFTSNGRSYTVSWDSTTQAGAVGTTLGYNTPLVGAGGYLQSVINGVSCMRSGSTTTGPNNISLDGAVPPGNPSTGATGPSDVTRYVECWAHIHNAKGKVVPQIDKVTFRYKVVANAPIYSNDFFVDVTFAFKAAEWISATAGSPGSLATNAQAWPLGDFFTVTNGASNTKGNQTPSANGTFTGSVHLLGGVGYVSVTLPNNFNGISTYRTLLTTLDSLSSANPGTGDGYVFASCTPSNLTGP